MLLIDRHETPVLAKPIEILYIDQDLVVLDKPGSIPVHNFSKNLDKSSTDLKFFFLTPFLSAPFFSILYLYHRIFSTTHNTPYQIMFQSNFVWILKQCKKIHVKVNFSPGPFYYRHNNFSSYYFQLHVNWHECGGVNPCNSIITFFVLCIGMPQAPLPPTKNTKCIYFIISYLSE